MPQCPSHHYEGAVLIAPKAQDAYFRRYRDAHPEETFDLIDLESLEEMFWYSLAKGSDEVLLELGVKKEGLEMTKAIIRRLRYAPHIDVLKPYLLLRDELEKKGLLQVLNDPFIYFKDRWIIIRGYFDGRAISEAMQDLPNICVNFDFGQEPPLEIDPVGVSLQTALARVQSASGPIYLYAPDGMPIPDELKGLPRLEEPHAPVEGRFIAYKPNAIRLPPDYPLNPAISKALRFPSISERTRRLQVETKYLLRCPRLLAFLP